MEHEIEILREFLTLHFDNKFSRVLELFLQMRTFPFKRNEALQLESPQNFWLHIGEFNAYKRTNRTR